MIKKEVEIFKKKYIDLTIEIKHTGIVKAEVIRLIIGGSWNHSECTPASIHVKKQTFITVNKISCITNGTHRIAATFILYV